MGSGCIDPRFIDLGTSWKGSVSFTPLLLYLRGNSLRYPLDMRLDGPQNRYGRHGEVKILDPIGNRTPNPSVVQPVASRYTDCVTAAHNNINNLSVYVVVS
jgi:hypothetical protein